MQQTTATVTWIASPNFGTYLQAYALQQIVQNLGYENIIINDQKVIDAKKVVTLRMIIGRIKNRILEMVHIKEPEIHNDSLQLYDNFKNKYLKIDSAWEDYNQLSTKYDMYICGSDQIWSPYLDFEPYYYLGFTNRKKIAYAPSTGTKFCTEDYQKNTKALLESFNYISVREEDGANMLRTFINKEISVVLDPTLLLTQKEWEKVSTIRSNNEHYILCYFLTPNKWYLDYVHEYAKRNGIKVKIFYTDPIFTTYGFDCICAGPSEFISYIKGAEKVFTDSYHSSIFSILFQKEFITFKRFIDGGERDQNARIANLFEKLGISERFIGNDHLETIDKLSQVDYVKVGSILEEYRKHSIDYLRNALAD